MQRNFKRLKQFLEDYDVKRNSATSIENCKTMIGKSWKGKPAKPDNRDRIKETQEIEKHKSNIFPEEFEDPSAEFEWAKN